jgi:hypothetical protein
MTISDDAWDRRVLCSDGNCIGIIGTDGRCKTCGKPYEGDLPQPAADSETMAEGVETEPADQQLEKTNDSIDDEPSDDSQPKDDAWENRILCIDESCIGVVGPDGRCNECGKPYPG